MQEITGKEPVMWGDSIVGFGQFHYKYKSGREGDWFQLGFAPRKQNISIYSTFNLQDFEKQLDKIGKHKKGKGCLYVKNLDQIDIEALKTFLQDAVNHTKTMFGNE